MRVHQSGEFYKASKNPIGEKVDKILDAQKIRAEILKKADEFASLYLDSQEDYSEENELATQLYNEVGDLKRVNSAEVYNLAGRDFDRAGRIYHIMTRISAEKNKERKEQDNQFYREQGDKYVKTVNNKFN
jgi:hypothetical protein